MVGGEIGCARVFLGSRRDEREGSREVYSRLRPPPDPTLSDLEGAQASASLTSVALTSFGTALSAFDTGQFSLAVSACWRNSSSLMPGISARVLDRKSVV